MDAYLPNLIKDITDLKIKSKVMEEGHTYESQYHMYAYLIVNGLVYTEYETNSKGDSLLQGFIEWFRMGHLPLEGEEPAATFDPYFAKIGHVLYVNHFVSKTRQAMMKLYRRVMDSNTDVQYFCGLRDKYNGRLTIHNRIAVRKNEK